MKIRLIEPQAPGVNVFDRARLPRLGLPLLGQLLAQRGHDVRIYVETLGPVDWRDVAGSDLVGFSTITSTAPAAYEMARRVRETGIPTVIGGPHVTFLAQEGLTHCDFVVRGEGQETAVELVEALERGADPCHVAGLSYRGPDGEPVHNPDRPPMPQEMFARLPAPALHLIVGYERMTNVPIMTQWGCPYRCDFCAVVEMFGHRVRSRPIDAVLAELERHRDRGAVFFYDDNFVVNRARTRALLQGMIDRGLTPSWSAQVRAEMVYRDRRSGELDHELLSLMRDAGCSGVYCGFESVEPATLAAYNKQQGVQDIRDSVRAFHSHGIRVHGMFVLGADTDDQATFRRTVDFALENEIDTVQFLMLTPCPGTPFFERMAAQDRLLTDDWSLYDGHHCVIQPARMTPYQLQMGTVWAMTRFYSARRALWQLVTRVARNLPFMARLLWRERRLRLELPRLAILSLIPSRRPDVLGALKRILRGEPWQRLQRMLTRPLLHLYAWRHIREWKHQARSRSYLRFLRQLGRRHRGQVSGTA
jgi:radical SAM superfamily enzyme YgiQ (UPF0313 family)